MQVCVGSWVARCIVWRGVCEQYVHIRASDCHGHRWKRCVFSSSQMESQVAHISYAASLTRGINTTKPWLISALHRGVRHQ